MTSFVRASGFERGTAPVAPMPTTRLHVRPVNAETADAFGDVVKAGFDLPVAMTKWFAALFGRSGWRLYLAYDGETASAPGAFVQHGVAWLGIDGTLAAYRRCGAQMYRSATEGLSLRGRASGTA
jgi:hypothetical protein